MTFNLANVPPFHELVHGGTWNDHPTEYFWRVESICTWGCDGLPNPHIYYERYALLRHTPLGVWVIPYSLRNPGFEFQNLAAEQSKKHVLHAAKRKHAYPTKAEAWKSFLIRQSRRVQHCKNNLERAEAIRDLALKITEKGGDA